MKHARFYVLLLSAAFLAWGFLVFRHSTTTGGAWSLGKPAGDSASPGSRSTAYEEHSRDEEIAAGSQSTDVAGPLVNRATKATRHLAIHVSGLKEQASSLHVAVFDSAEGFPDPERSQATKRIPVASGTVDFSLSVPDGSTHGIAVFQDLNGDGKLTKNVLGLPMEPYGFSNNARSKFGPPSFREAAFMVKEDASSVEIRVR